MSTQTWQETLVAQGTAGSIFDTYTTAKTVIPATSLYTFGPNAVNVGKTLRITAAGALGTLVTTPGLVAFQVMLGSIVAFTTGNIQMNATAHTLLPWWLNVLLTCRAVGSSTSANFMGMGQVQGIALTLTAAQVDAVNTGGIFSAPATTPTVGTGFDSTIANILDFWVGFTISSASNRVRVDHYLVEAIN